MIKDFDYDEFMDSMGLDNLTEKEKTSIKTMFQYRKLDEFIKEFPHYTKVIDLAGNDRTSNYYIFFSNIYILKYLLESNSKSDKIIEQNNQIIELLQKIADK